nr:hypothetical protein [Tanacetum cinerariifolium]
MSPPDPNNTYIQPPLGIQILEFIETLGYDEDLKTKLIVVSKMRSDLDYNSSRPMSDHSVRTYFKEVGFLPEVVLRSEKNLFFYWVSPGKLSFTSLSSLDLSFSIRDKMKDRYQECLLFSRKGFEFKIRRRFFERCFDFIIDIDGDFLEWRPDSKIELFLFDSNNYISSVKKRSSHDERNFAIFFHFEDNEIDRKDSSSSSSLSKLIRVSFCWSFGFFGGSYDLPLPVNMTFTFSLRACDGSESKLHSSQDDHPITKLLNTTNGDYKFGMEVLDAMISDAIKKKAVYKYYMAKKVETNVPNKLKKDDVPRKTSSLTIAKEAVVDMYNKRGQKIKGPTVKDPAVQSLLDLRKGSKARRLESLMQKKQLVAREGSNELKESANETDDADEFDMDLSHDNPHGDDDDARRTVIKNKLEDIQLGVESNQRTLNLTKPTMFFEGIDQRIPFTMTVMHKGVVYLNQYNIKSLMKLSEVKKFCNGTLMKIQENMIDMLLKNKLGSGNKRLKERDWTDYDVKSLREMLKKINEILRHIE